MSPQHTRATMDPGDVKSVHPVFLCHSGTQKGFVAQLDKDLRNVDRYPFFDKDRESLPIGDNFPDLILKAIEECQVGVVILSEDFFMRSYWPMFEVARMIECGRKIIPVFLGIFPEDLSKETTLVRWKSKWEDWKKLNKRIDIAKWEEALRCLRPLNGLVCKDAAAEVEFREEIVKEICKIVPAFYRPWDDSHVQGKFRLSKIIREKIAETAVDGVRMVGLYGVGGVGKTTACKSLCNDVLMEFGGRVCHVEFGNGTSAKGRVQEVLRRLTSTSNEFLNDKDMDEDNCWSRLKDLVPENKVFLAIDNVSSDWKVSEETQEYLRLKYFQGSVVMVTARALDELEYLGLDGASCLAMPELVKHEARDLFLYCARRHGDVIDEGVIACCIKRCYFGKGGGKGGHYHPLALKVLGSHMVGRDPAEWKSQLEDVEDVFNQRREQEHPVFSILRRSFDELLDEDKALFMDVALIRVEYRYGRFSSSLFNPSPGGSEREWLSIVHSLNMEVLKERLNGLKKRAMLVEVGDGPNQLGMHDLWREFAVKETKRGEQDGRSWVYEVVKGEGEDSSLSGGGWKKLRRICIQAGAWRGYPSVKCLELSDCFKVTVLRLVEVDVDNQEVDLSPLRHLKSLEIVVDRYRHGKSELRVSGIGKLKNLAVLLWYGVSEACSSAFGEISCLSYLQVLHLESSFNDQDLCTRLDSSKLSKLQQVRLGCSGMVTLSGLSSRMSQLRILDLSDCQSIRSCPGVGDVIGLEVLLLYECRNLEELPNLEKLTKLRILDIKDCLLLKALLGLGSLVALQKLRAAGCRDLDELPDISRLTNLEVLDLEGCRSLKGTPLGFSNLVALHTCRVPGAFMSDWPNLTKLTKFNVVLVGSNDYPLNGLQLGLCFIDASDGFGVGYRLGWNLPGLSVSTLRLFWIWEDFGLTNLSTLTALKRVEINNCSLEKLPDMGKDMTLESLRITKCHKLRGWDGVGRLGRSQSETAEVDGHCNWTLSELQVFQWWHSDVVELPDLSHMPRLRRLSVNHGGPSALPSGWPHFAVQCRVDHMHLEILIFRSSAIAKLPDLTFLPGLKVLKIDRCHILTSLTCSRPLPSLQSLSLRYCSRLVKIPSFDLFPGLHSVTVVRKSRGVKLNVEDLKARCSFLSVDGNVYVDLPAGIQGFSDSDSWKYREFEGGWTDSCESESDPESDSNDWVSDGGWGDKSETNREESDSLSMESEFEGDATVQIALQGPNHLHDAARPSSVQEEASCSHEFVPHSDESITESVLTRPLELRGGGEVDGEVEEGQLKKRKLVTLDLFR